MKKFYLRYNEEDTKLQQAVAVLPWSREKKLHSHFLSSKNDLQMLRAIRNSRLSECKGDLFTVSSERLLDFVKSPLLAYSIKTRKFANKLEATT